MLGDVLLIEEKHNKAAGKLQDLLQDVDNDKFIIAISGESGSGKSELAHVLAKNIKKTGDLAKILHIDNYYRIPPRERTIWRQENSYESVGLNEYDWDLINKNIEEFLDNKIAMMPSIDLLTDQVDQLTTNFRGIRFLIIEGLYSIKADADMRVFIDLTYHDTKKAQLVRGKEPQNEHRLKVLEREHKIVQSLRPLADIMVAKDFDVTKVKFL
jgi:uridine kinase